MSKSPVLTLADMRQYLGRSIASLNQNKLRGLLAEIDLRRHLRAEGFEGSVSRGGWIARAKRGDLYGSRHVVLFPETVKPRVRYPAGRILPSPDIGLHTICATFHQSGITPYFCAISSLTSGTPELLEWKCVQLGVPVQQAYVRFPEGIEGFMPRAIRYNPLRYNSPTSAIPNPAVPEEFSKENLRVVFQRAFFSEMSDVDGLFWGRQHTYPLEIKEKTAAADPDMGPYFGLDVGPFVKLAFYAAKRGNLRSLFIVREIDNVTDRRLVQWWWISFDRLAQFASWTPVAGGRNMGGGSSSVVKIPRSEFSPLTAKELAEL